MFIACATDEAYAEMAGVMLRSIAANGDVADIGIVLIGDGLSEDTIAALKSCAAGLDFRVVDLGTARHSIARLPVSLYSTAIHIRLLLPDLIKGVGRILYLDCDTFVNRSLRPLFEMSLGDSLLAAVEDFGRAAEHVSDRLGRPTGSKYFNSGVLLFELEQWRDERIGLRCIELAQSRSDFWPDQDAINIVLNGRIKELERVWNFWSHDRLPRSEFEQAHIIHFIPDKPLSRHCPNPIFPDFMAMRALTPWRNKELPEPGGDQRAMRFAQLAAERVRVWKASR